MDAWRARQRKLRGASFPHSAISDQPAPATKIGESQAVFRFQYGCQISPTTAMQHVPPIALTRSGTLECQHFGSVAVVNAQGKLLAHAGDGYFPTFSRSTLKALQARPFVEAGGPHQFKLGMQHIALSPFHSLTARS